MKIQLAPIIILVTTLLCEKCNAYAFINNGTFVTGWNESCSDVIAANEWDGTCCSFSDIDESGQKCRLTVAGQDEYCAWTNKKYLEECTQAGVGCLAGPYVLVEYAEGVPVEECPESQYQIEPPSTFSPTPAPTATYFLNVTYEITEFCPTGTITALVQDFDGVPVAGTPVGFLLVGNGTYTGSVISDTNGYAAFTFTANNSDAGAMLWCSIAVNNPEAPPGHPNIQVPCGVPVCTDMPPPSCMKTRGAPFNVGYGTCETYIDENSSYCMFDFDVESELFAYEACSECGQCEDPQS